MSFGSDPHFIPSHRFQLSKKQHKPSIFLLFQRPEYIVHVPQFSSFSMSKYNSIKIIIKLILKNKIKTSSIKLFLANSVSFNCIGDI